MHTSFSLFEKAHHAKFLGTRHRAKELRKELQQILDRGGELILDFSGFDATQSFIDELIGQLVLRQGEAILNRVAFKGCSEDVEAIIRFVVSDRIVQFNTFKISLP